MPIRYSLSSEVSPAKTLSGREANWLSSTSSHSSEVSPAKMPSGREANWLSFR